MTRLFLLLSLAVLASCTALPLLGPADYDSVRKQLVTRATRAPSPQGYDESTPPGVEAIRYTAEDGELLAWVMRPSGTSRDKPLPVVVYAHGGFALGAGDVDDARAFAKAGFIVVLPALRGENGNPGNFELFLGEVDDLMAAGRKARSLPGADANRLYLFGHSIGGGLATLVRLSKENPYRVISSSGGMYSAIDCAGIAEEWGTFDGNDQSECRARFPDAFLPTVFPKEMDTSSDPDDVLISYVGKQDGYAVLMGAQLTYLAGPPFITHQVEGDHMTSLAASIRLFLQRIG